jgi:hypothetical protein
VTGLHFPTLEPLKAFSAIRVLTQKMLAARQTLPAHIFIPEGEGVLGFPMKAAALQADSGALRDLVHTHGSQPWFGFLLPMAHPTGDVFVVGVMHRNGELYVQHTPYRAEAGRITWIGQTRLDPSGGAKELLGYPWPTASNAA